MWSVVRLVKVILAVANVNKTDSKLILFYVTSFKKSRIVTPFKKSKLLKG